MAPAAHFWAQLNLQKGDLAAFSQTLSGTFDLFTIKSESKVFMWEDGDVGSEWWSAPCRCLRWDYGTWERERGRNMLCLSSGAASFEGPRAFAVFEGESFGETLLTVSTVVKRDSLVFGALPGCVTRCFTLTSRESDYVKRCWPFFVFLTSFSGAQRILGYGRWWRMVVVHPPQGGKRRPHLIGLQMQPKDADPELRHCNRDTERDRKPCVQPLKMGGVCVCVCVCVCVWGYPVRRGQTPQTAVDSSSPRCRRPPAPL